MNCPFCGDEIPEYSNLDFHVQTEHGFSVPSQYTQDTITRSMKDPDFDKIESYEYTQKQLEDAKHWWQKAKLPHENVPWNELRIGDRQKIIGRYADHMYNKYVVGKEGQRDLKPTGKNHGIDFYTQMALDDYMNNTYHTPEEYENALYGIDGEAYSNEDTAMKRYGVLRELPNGEEIVDSAYGTELHAKDWWDSKTVKNEKGDGKSRKWDDLDPEERKSIRKLFDKDVKEEYLADEAVGLSRDWDEDEKEFSKHVDGTDTLFRDEDTGFYKDVPSGGEPWQEGEESTEDEIRLLKELGIADKTLREIGYNVPHEKWFSEESWKCNICGKEFGVAGNRREGERFQHMMEHEKKGEEGVVDDIEEILNKYGINLDKDPEQLATEGGFGSGRKGHSAWMRDMEFGGNYKVCPNCKVNTSFENNKCMLCGN